MPPARQSGVAAIEFALVLPLLLMLMFLATEFGRALYHYNVIVKSTRDAVRYLSIQTPGTHTAEAANLIVYGNVAGTGSSQLPDLSLSQVQAPVWATTGENPLINTVTVEVRNYTFRPMAPSVFGLSFDQFVFSPIRATMRSAI